MSSAEDPRAGGSERAVATSERAYRAMIWAYPKDLRAEYGEEMVRGFRDLCREESRDRSAKGIAALWARTLPELALTALKERSSMLSRNAYLPVSPAFAARWGGLSALLGGASGMVAYYVGVSISMPISAVVLLLSTLLSTLGLLGLYGALSAPSGRPGRLAAAGAMLAVAAVGSWLALGVSWALGLAWEWPVWPTHIAAATGVLCWFIGLLLLGVAAAGRRLPGRLRALPLVVIALVPVSIVVPSFTTLGMPLVVNLPFLGTAFLGWFLLRSDGVNRLAGPGGATPGSGKTALRMAGAVGRSAGGRQRTLTGATVSEAAQEKELLEALRRRGELTVAGAALETSLTVEEIDRMLSALAVKGHLEVRVERGRMLYSLWEGDA